MSKVIKLNYVGEDFNLYIVLNKYATTDNLYVGLVSEDGGLFGDVTVNLMPIKGKMKKNYGFVDVNNLPYLEELIRRYKLGKKTNQCVQSGFVNYPLYEFNLDVLEQYVKKDYYI